MKNPGIENIAVLDYLWWGVAIGGRHYTGSVKARGKTVELIRKLSRREAKELSEREGRMWLRHQTETNKFEDFKSMARHATRWCEQNMGADWLLQEHSDLNPERVIATAGYFKPRKRLLQKLALAWGKVPDSQRKGELWDQVYATYDALILPPSTQ